MADDIVTRLHIAGFDDSHPGALVGAAMRFVSLFSGVGGFDLGLEAAGWQCVAQVEWDKNCQAVLARHWPDVPRWSDVADVSGYELPPADVVAFGSPCQDLSVAGKRAGFGGERSVLFYEATRIIREMRDATGNALPRFVIWENVAGALSSFGGRDFAAVLDELAELGAVDISWRVLDARWFGVPQRRRRVFVVADLAGECAGAIHADPEGVPWHPRTGRTPGQGAAATAGGGAASGFVATHTHVAALTSTGVGTCGADDNQAQAGHLVPVFSVAAQVRRLTPVECERLMGWPDDHTRWRADGTEVADSHRYRMCGNGVASPVAEWIADRINAALKEARRG